MHGNDLLWYSASSRVQCCVSGAGIAYVEALCAQYPEAKKAQRRIVEQHVHVDFAEEIHNGSNVLCLRSCDTYV